jgi:hypothetical protein
MAQECGAVPVHVSLHPLPKKAAIRLNPANEPGFSGFAQF